MDGKRLVFLLAFSAGVGGLAACGSSSRVGGPDGAPTFTFSGTVRSGAAGLAGVQVFLSGAISRTAQTDSQGAFSFSEVSGKSFLVSVALDGYVFTPPSYTLGPASRTDLNFSAAALPRTTGPLSVGDTAPDFSAFDQNKQTISLYSYRGKVVLIDLSADWCGSCKAEAPALEALYQKYKDQGFQVLTILVDGSAATWASAYKVTHPVIEDTTRTLSAAYATGWLPTHVILDRTLTIRYKEGEDYDEALIVSLIKPYLEGSGVR